MRVVVCTLMILGIALPGAVVATPAAPCADVEELMSEPLSMFDWGLFRLRDFLEAELDGVPLSPRPDVTVRYTRYSNRIVIRLFSITSCFGGQDEAREWCTAAASLVRVALGVDPEFEGRQVSRLGSFFQHVEVEQGVAGRHPGIGEELDSMTVIEVRLGYRIDAPAEERYEMTCCGPLVGRDLSLTIGAVDCRQD